jgi:hypothetical protein
MIPTPLMRSMTVVRVTGSLGLTPKIRRDRTLEAKTEPTDPITSPIMSR